jgi:vacuolar-type H+-ATPase subunit H
MGVEFLKIIRETEKKCEQKLKKAETSKQNALMEAEKSAVLRIRDAEIQAKEEADKILSSVGDKVEKEYIKVLNIFEEEQNKLKEKAKKIEKKAVDYILSNIF